MTSNNSFKAYTNNNNNNKNYRALNCSEKGIVCLNENHNRTMAVALRKSEKQSIVPLYS
ncbi:hypothetical protein TYRP_014362, partial [Tyrophagus putrescentiae]